MEQIRIIKEMREYDRRANGRADDLLRPRYMVWENVLGSFSSNKGEDFRVVLEETARVADKDAVIPGLAKGQKWAYSGCIMGDGWSIAWRVHDAQFWGVPQRRKRIALVADFGGSSAPEILFERKGLSGDTEQSRPQGEETSRQTEGGVGTANYTLKIRGGREVDSAGKRAGKGPLIQKELSGTLGVSQDQTLFQDRTYQQVAGTLSPGAHAGSYNGQDAYNDMLITDKAVVYGISPYDSNAMKSSNPNSGIYEADTARTLDNNGGSPACNQGGMLVLDKHNMSVNEDKTQTLIQGEKNKEVPVISYGLDRASFNQGQNAQFDFSVEEELSPTIVSRGAGGGNDETVGSLCARDYKGVGSQYVREGKVIVQDR